MRREYRSPFMKLPSEVTFHILKLLNFGELGKIATVDKYLYTFVHDNYLWRPFYNGVKDIEENTCLYDKARIEWSKHNEGTAFGALRLLITPSLRVNPHKLTLNDVFKENMNIFLVAVRINGLALQHAGVSVQSQRKIGILAVRSHPRAIEYVSKELQDDPEIVSLAVNRWRDALKHVSDRFKDNLQTVLTAVANGGWQLQYASARLRDNITVVTAAVKQDGRALVHASPRLKDTEDVVLSAINRSGAEAHRYASERLRNDFNMQKATHSKFGFLTNMRNDELMLHPLIEGPNT